jgi:hypothetical protein
VGEVDYKSTLLTSCRIHLIFYVSLLKRDIFNSTVELELVVYYVWKALVVLDIGRYSREVRLSFMY